MLIQCPECARSVSDRAASCPQCGFPIAEHVAQQTEAAQRAAEVQSRQAAGDADCPSCEARGFAMIDAIADDGTEFRGFSWCERCGHRGTIALVHSARGYWAVTAASVAAFVAGELPDDDDAVTFLGQGAPTRRYPSRG